MDVYQLNQLINFGANKENTGEYLKPAAYNRLLQAANVELFNREREKVKAVLISDDKISLMNEEIGEMIRNFNSTLELSTIPASGKIAYPYGFTQARTLSGDYDGKIFDVKIISLEMFAKRRGNPLLTSPEDEPYAAPDATFLKVRPKTMTNVELVYLRRPRTPYFNYTKNATTDRSEYIAAEEIQAEGVITITDTGADGDLISASVTAGSDTFYLGDYIRGSDDDDVGDVAQFLAQDINRRSVTHHFTASAVAGVITVTSPVGSGTAADSYVLEVTGGGTIAATVTTQYGVTVAVPGSTQLEWDPIYHMEIAKIIFTHIGISLSDERLLALQTQFGIQSRTV